MRLQRLGGYAAIASAFVRRTPSGLGAGLLEYGGAGEAALLIEEALRSREHPGDAKTMTAS